MIRQIILGLVILHLLGAVFLYYPTLRLGQWLALNDVLVQTLSLTLLFSQFFVRVVLRRVHNRATKGLRIVADFFLGLSPVMLVSVGVCELLLVIIVIPTSVIGWSLLMLWLIAGLWGTVKAWYPDIVRIKLESNKLKKSITFVQISDVHIGSRTTQFLHQVVQEINALGPDFLCITGDFIDQRDINAAQLQPLTALRMPVYFCTGNHEHYEDLEAILARLTNLGVEVLRGRYVDAHGLQIIGFDDHSNPDFLRDALPALNLNRQRYALLLFHRPLGLEHAAANGIDLQISGHTHNGQIVPFNLLVRSQFKYLKGLHKNNATHLYVNEGTGTWGPVMRLGTRSEITHFEITTI